MAAKKRRKTRKKLQEDLEQSPKQGEWAALVEYVKANPLISTALVSFILLCALAGLVYRLNAMARDQRIATEYAEALANDDPALRAAQLAPLAETADRRAPEALYMMAEAAFQAKDFDKAKAAYERVRQQFTESPFTPDAVEGVGYIAENQGNYEAALTLYREILTKWPDSFAGIRQEFNIARCQERLGNIAEAVKSYQSQVALFPDSGIAADAENALGRLRLTHPDLFAEEEAEEEPQPDNPTPSG